MSSRYYLEIGNSTIKVGCTGADGGLQLQRFDRRETFDAWAIASGAPLVVAPVGERLSGLVVPFLREHAEVRVLERGDVASFVDGSYDTPETLGLDRALNLLGMSGDGVVISCGTAITVDALYDGRPVWGAILPGFRTAAEGLHARIPVLPLVALDAVPHLPARTTDDSLANGILDGTAYAALGLARALATSLGLSAYSSIVCTGGEAGLVARLAPGSVVDDVLLIRGMMRVVEA